MNQPKKRAIHGDLAGGNRESYTLKSSWIVFGLTDDLIDLTKIHLSKKKSKVLSPLKKYSGK